MITIETKVIGESIQLLSSPVVASKSVKSVQILFDFDDAWDGFGRIALFWSVDDEVYTSQIINGVTIVPHEALDETGKIKFGVYGTNGSKRIVTPKTTYKIVEGAYTSVATESVVPSPTLLDQIEAGIGEMETKVDEMRELVRGSRSLVAIETYDSSKSYAIGSVVMYNGKFYECVVAIKQSEEWTREHWAERDVDYFLAHMVADFPRYGVSGVGGSNAALTRIWDAEGLTAPVPSTDTIPGSSPFDNIAPFNRKKCVGTWAAGADGKAVFTVNAYYGDPDYTEDGSNGDYVAVEVDPFYYYEADGTIGVSEYEYPGFTIHPVCVDLDGNIREHTYLPCYALALKDGKAVSLPGYQNQRGGYADLRNMAKQYANTGAAQYAIIEPSAVWHYEWLLQTIEFATQNMQSVMNGAVSMRRNKDDIIVAVPGANKVVVGSAGSNYVVGQTVLLGTYDANVDVALYNCITAIEKCTADGTPSESGTYYLITYDGTDRSSSLTVNTSALDSRPWITGATGGYAPGVAAVLGHTGSPVSLSNGLYPMRYRWRENVYGNQNMTALDLADVRVDDGDEKYHLEWYFLTDPRLFGASNFSKTDLQNPEKGWVKLGVETPKESYVSGYIKTLAADPVYPHVKVPILTTGGSASTFTCDYAYLVNSPEVRAVRRGGYVNSGAYAGPCYFYANNAPSNAAWHYGAALYMLQ